MDISIPLKGVNEGLWNATSRTLSRLPNVSEERMINYATLFSKGDVCQLIYSLEKEPGLVSDPKALNLLGLAYMKLGQARNIEGDDSYEEYYLKADVYLRQSEDVFLFLASRAISNRAKSLIERREFEKAENALNHAKEIYPKNPQVWVNIAELETAWKRNTKWKIEFSNDINTLYPEWIDNYDVKERLKVDPTIESIEELNYEN